MVCLCKLGIAHRRIICLCDILLRACVYACQVLNGGCVWGGQVECIVSQRGCVKWCSFFVVGLYFLGVWIIDSCWRCVYNLTQWGSDYLVGCCLVLNWALTWFERGLA